MLCNAHKGYFPRVLDKAMGRGLDVVVRSAAGLMEIGDVLYLTAC